MNRVVKMLTVWCVCVWGTSLADMCDRRDKRTDRAWRGDVGELEVFPGGTVRDRLQLHHRVRRFLSFPTGSVLSVTPKLTIPFVSKFDGYITGSQLYAFPIDLKLPNSTLRLRSKDRDEETMSYASYGSSDHAGYVRRTGRALDDQRITGFAFLRQLMDNVGLDGRQCLLRAVCEVGEEPVADLGITGELINLFFSAGYGSGTQELTEYIQAEEAGRQVGGCEDLYSGCPYRLMSLLQSAFSCFHLGLAHVGDTSGSLLVS